MGWESIGIVGEHGIVTTFVHQVGGNHHAMGQQQGRCNIDPGVTENNTSQAQAVRAHGIEKCQAVKETPFAGFKLRQKNSPWPHDPTLYPGSPMRSAHR